MPAAVFGHQAVFHAVVVHFDVDGGAGGAVAFDRAGGEFALVAGALVRGEVAEDVHRPFVLHLVIGGAAGGVPAEGGIFPLGRARAGGDASCEGDDDG